MSAASVLAGERLWWVEQGDWLDVAPTLPAGCVQTVATSPPFWSLRDYRVPARCWSDGWTGCLGLEPSPLLFVEHMVDVFRAVKRVLRPDGTVWLNMGDSYAGNGGSMRDTARIGSGGGRPDDTTRTYKKWLRDWGALKPKDLCLIPERLAIALQDDGWWVRKRITWAKRAAMPDSTTDRPTSATEVIWLLTKQRRYFYDNIGSAEPAVCGHPSGNGYGRPEQHSRGGRGSAVGCQPTALRNMRDYWLVDDELGGDLWELGPEPLADDHYAAWPTEIPKRAILAGTSERGCCPACLAPWRRVVEPAGVSDNNGGGRRKHAAVMPEVGTTSAFVTGKSTTYRTAGWEPTCACPPAEPIPCLVLDPFSGSGRTGIAALRLGRRYLGVELSEYQATKSRARIVGDSPMWNRQPDIEVPA